MNLNQLKGKISGFIAAIFLLSGIVIASSATASAQYQQYPQYPQYPVDARQQREYEREQRRRQRQYEREQRRREREARRNGGYGNYGNYGNYGYGNYGYGNYGYGVSYELRQTALNAGYNEGMKAGREDRSRGRRYDYSAHDSYRNATTDYNSRLGDRELYRQIFRQGFVNGYTDAFRVY